LHAQGEPHDIRNFVRPVSTILLAASAALTSACAHEPALPLKVPDACALVQVPDPDADLQLPFQIVHGRVYAQASVNGQGPFTFAIDTGASGLGRVDTSLTTELGLSISGAASNSDGVTTAQADTVQIDELTLGGMTLTGLDLITRDYNRGLPDEAAIAGIIGREFFADGLLVIDFPNQTVWFSRNRALTAETPGALPYERPFRVPVSFGDHTIEGNLDTGAAVSLMVPRSLYDQVSGGALEAAGTGQLSNGEIRLDRGRLDGPVRIGSAEIFDVDVRVSDEFPELFVGGDVLRSYVVAFDQRARFAAVCSPGG